MRVVAGRWKGRRLHLPTGTGRGKGPRPTTDRVKEALFSILGRRVEGGRVVDLCCGSGGLGIEALSRGALHCDFVDIASGAIAATGRNLEICGADPRSFALHKTDARRYLDHLGASPEPLLLLCDPPYGLALAGNIWHGMLELALGEDLSVAVLEHEPGLELPEPPPRWRRQTRRYGNSELTILEMAT